MGMVLKNNKCNVKSISLIKAAVHDPPLYYCSGCPIKKILSVTKIIKLHMNFNVKIVKIHRFHFSLLS